MSNPIVFEAGVFETGKLYSNEWYYLMLYTCKTDAIGAHSIGRLEKSAAQQTVKSMCEGGIKIPRPSSFFY